MSNRVANVKILASRNHAPKKERGNIRAGGKTTNITLYFKYTSYKILLVISYSLSINIIVLCIAVGSSAVNKCSLGGLNGLRINRTKEYLREI
jgi:hypothetical protein